MRVQALGAKATVERRYDGGVRHLAQQAKVQRHVVLVCPAVACFRDESRTIVHANDHGRAADRQDPCHCFDRLFALDALVDINRSVRG